MTPFLRGSGHSQCCWLLSAHFWQMSQRSWSSMGNMVRGIFTKPPPFPGQISSFDYLSVVTGFGIIKNFKKKNLREKYGFFLPVVPLPKLSSPGFSPSLFPALVERSSEPECKLSSSCTYLIDE